MTTRNLLVVDDEPKMRRVLEMMLGQMGHRVDCAGNGIEAMEILAERDVDLVITDLRMPAMDGLGLLMAMANAQMDIPVIVITAHGTVETAVQAIKLGAVDYLLRPFDLDVLELAVTRALGEAQTRKQNLFLRSEIDRGWHAFVGQSPQMRQVYDLIERVAASRASAFIIGETGTGKELAARALHKASPRADKLFVPINCAAIPAEILESELFGYTRGAFTGALKDRVGKFELADGGTIFLDELTEMPIALQAKLLRVLQEGHVERLGSNRTLKLDLRVIAASNRDPLQAVADGLLREDLYYRINVVSIPLPPLRERKEDIGPLLAHFKAKHAAHGREIKVSPLVIERLQSYDWPGNVRELENMVERALILSGGRDLNQDDFPVGVQGSRVSKSGPALEGDGKPQAAQGSDLGPRGLSLPAAVEALEARMISEALKLVGGNKARAAAMLDISERSLWYKLKKMSPEG